jgi:hypothetical protein
MSQYVLRFISGKDKGREYMLAADRHIMIGRDTGVDLLLVDNKVSRQHAAITTHAGQVMLHDMESRNGTFVNDRRISTSLLKVGDEIILGSSRMRLELTSQAMPVDGQVMIKSGAVVEESKPKSKAEVLMQGDISRIALPDLIQMLSASNKTGRLAIRSDEGQGKIIFRDGRVCDASLDHHPDMPARKVFYRIIRWKQGKFELHATRDQKGGAPPAEITESTTTLLFEALRQLDEMTMLETQMPVPEARLTVPTPLADSLQDLSTDEIQIYQLAASHQSVQAVIDQYPDSDLEACTCLLRLLRGGLIAVDKRD